jgi:hypothetical protein
MSQENVELMRALYASAPVPDDPDRSSRDIDDQGLSEVVAGALATTWPATATSWSPISPRARRSACPSVQLA